MARGVAEIRSTGARLALPLLLAELAMALAARGRAGEGEAMLDEGARELEATGQHCFGPELHRVRGELLVHGARDRRAEAEGWLGHALAAAREQKARSWELRAATSLAQAWADRGERRKAQDLLAPICGWFTEGFDTPDLRDARALLGRLD
jgi:predicted ATPase